MYFSLTSDGIWAYAPAAGWHLTPWWLLLVIALVCVGIPAIIEYEAEQKKERETEKIFAQLPIITVGPEHIRTIPEPPQLPPPAPTRNPVADAIDAVYRDTK